MDRKDLAKIFANRLIAAMNQAGYLSSRSSVGVQISKLAIAAKCSHQMARKYVLGEALPEYDVILSIARWLNISPAWLLFGEEPTNNEAEKVANRIEIDADLLKYILKKVAHLYTIFDDEDELISFIIDIIYDATHLNAEPEAVRKIVDVAINSAQRFSTVSQKK